MDTSAVSNAGLVVHSQAELVVSLREQLSLQHQLASQFEVDLAARDELVLLLSTQLQHAEASADKYRKEVERRQSVMRALRRKLSELEKICRGLEEQVERSREESFERQKAEDEVALGSIKERVATLTDEVGRLRRQVHDLQQESADKEVKLLQLNKARAQDREDKEGLNIALDSKQQELELLKRKLGLKGTGGSTPAPIRVGLPDPSSRRHSLAFTTPSAPRPRASSTAILNPSVTETPSLF